MSPELAVYKILHDIVAVVGLSDSMRPPATPEQASYTDKAALAQVRALAGHRLDLLTAGEDISPAGPEARSSVAIETMAKGAPKITVKAYTGSPIAPALEQAKQAWSQLLDELVREARDGASGVQAP